MTTGKSLLLLHPLDFLKQLDQFVLGVIHQAAVAEAEITAGQRGERITERAASEAERFQKGRQLFVIVNQPAGRDAGGGLDADRMEKFVRPLDFPADVRQAAVFFVLRDVVRVNGHDDAGQAVAGKAAHVFLGPQARRWCRSSGGCRAPPRSASWRANRDAPWVRRRQRADSRCGFSGRCRSTRRASSSVTLRRALGSNLERANPQKSQSALQMLVMANCR